MTTEPTLHHTRLALPGIRSMLLMAAFTVLATLILLALSAFITQGRVAPSATANWALRVHLLTVIPALFLGAALLAMRKGTARHKMLGRVWAALMIVTAISSFWLRGLTGGIGPIHIFSVITLVSIPVAIWRIRRGDVRGHQRAMIGPYIGLLVAGLFAFAPGRLLGNLVLRLF